MYTLGIPNRQYRRTTQVLGPALANPISYEAHKQDDGFYMFSFPEIDEYEFEDIVLLLKNNGVTTIGADDTLTERNIMKLTDLLKEQGSNPEESNLFDELTLWLEKVRSNEPASRYATGSIAGEKNERTNNYEQDIEEMLESIENPLTNPDDQEEEENEMNFASDDARDFRPMQEQGLNRMDRDMTPEEEFLKDNPSPGTSSPMDNLNTRSGEFEVDVDVMNAEQKVKIKYGQATGMVDDVTISWDNESHNVDFEAEDVIDDHGNEGKDMTFVAYSQDDKWRFIVDVSVEYNYENSGNIQDVDWDTLEIDVDDNLRLEPEDNEYEDGTPFYGDDDDLELEPELDERYEKKLLQVRAGIIK